MHKPAIGHMPLYEPSTRDEKQRDRAPVWNALAVIILVAGIAMVSVSAVTLCYAGLSGTLACLVCGCAATVLARRARFWN